MRQDVKLSCGSVIRFKTGFSPGNTFVVLEGVDGVNRSASFICFNKETGKVDVNVNATLPWDDMQKLMAVINDWIEFKPVFMSIKADNHWSRQLVRRFA